MGSHPCENQEPTQSILRDQLAIDRTVLAFERTYLAYVRTGLTFFIAGVTFIKLLEGVIVQALGWVFLPIGLLVALLGYRRYRQIKRSLDACGKLTRSTDAGLM